MPLRPEQRERMIAFLGTLPWADVDGAIRSLESPLRLLLEVTHVDFLRWEAEGEQRYGDEFSVTASELEEMPEEYVRGYIARLIWNVALMYGESGLFLDLPDPSALVPAGSVETDPASIAGIVHALNDITWTPCVEPSDPSDDAD